MSILDHYLYLTHCDRACTICITTSFVGKTSREEDRKGYLTGNMNDHSLKMYLLTFLVRIADEDQTLGNHDAYLSKLKLHKATRSQAYSWDDYFLTWLSSAQPQAVVTPAGSAVN